MLSKATIINSSWNRQTACLFFLTFIQQQYLKKFECIFSFSFHILKALLNGCKKRWVPFGRKCYKFSSTKATFKDAKVG